MSFRSSREVWNAVLAVRRGAVAHEYTLTTPCPVLVPGGLVLRVVCCPLSGPIDDRRVEPPRYVCDVDPGSARVLRLARCTPDEVGVVPPLRPLSGAGIPEGLTLAEFEARDARLDDLAPEVWGAFARGDGPDAPSAPAAREFFAILLSLTRHDVAPLYPAVAPDFIRWLQLVSTSR